MTLSHLKQLQSSCGIIEDVIINAEEDFLKIFFNGETCNRLESISFDSDGAIVRLFFPVDNELTHRVSYVQLKHFMESL
jgi:hypothetical protein